MVTDDVESQLAQHARGRAGQLGGKATPKKKRRSGDAAALGMTSRERYYKRQSIARREGVVSCRWVRQVRPAVGLPRQ